MTIYAIGDVQGCYKPLQRLLDKLRFDPVVDKLWFAGDLVNRGPDSLDTLRFVKSLGENAVTVLGNHDLHLLATFYGLRPKDKDPCLTQVLDAPDTDELIGWLQGLPLLHTSAEFALVHAGIHPKWDIDTALLFARNAEEKLRAVKTSEDMAELYGPSPGNWTIGDNEKERLKYTINSFTRMRFCTRESVLDFSHACAPGQQPPELIPWYSVDDRPAANTKIIFGHWAALGALIEDNIYALDSGCVWGNALTALNLTDLSLQQVFCTEFQDGSST